VIIGAGSMAKEHIRAFSDQSDVKVVGIYSRTIAKAQSLANEFNINLVAKKIEELYQKLSPDLVVVAVNIMVAKNMLKC